MWDHWQEEVGCLGSQGNYLMAWKHPWDESTMGRDVGQFYQVCLPDPPGGWMWLNVGAWWG